MRIAVRSRHMGATSSGRSGITLVECLVYISVWFVITGLAFGAYFRVLDNAKRIRRNAADVARALQAGEVWRRDIREASGPISCTNLLGIGEELLRIPQLSGEVSYRFTGSNVLRRANAEAPWTVALGLVNASGMVEARRDSIRSWKWEVELKSPRKAPRQKPLFSFQAVPSTPGTP